MEPGLEKRGVPVHACGNLEEEVPAAVSHLESEAIHVAGRIGSQFALSIQNLLESFVEAREVGSLAILQQHVRDAQVKEIDGHSGSPPAQAGSMVCGYPHRTGLEADFGAHQHTARLGRSSRQRLLRLLAGGLVRELAKLHNCHDPMRGLALTSRKVSR
jgi:hypothetical protein